MIEILNDIGTSGWFTLIVGLSSIISLIIGGRALYKCNIIIKNSMNNTNSTIHASGKNSMNNTNSTIHASGKNSIAAGRDVHAK